MSQQNKSTKQSSPLIPKLAPESSGQWSLQQQRELVPMHRKVEIFICSFLAYTSVHALRTTYSFSKSYLPDEINMEERLIGIVDSVMLLFIGLGNFLIAIRPLSNPIRALWLALFFCALEYCLVPISMKSLTGPAAFSVLLVLMGLSGYLQSFTWPNLLPLVHSVCSPDRDTTLLGFWATCPNFGNILGFVVCQLIVLNNGYSWELSMFIIAAYMLMNALYIAIRVDQMPTEQTAKDRAGSLNDQKKDSLLSQVKESESMEEPSPSIIKVFKNSPRVTLLTISFSLLKSVMYGILLWLPAYFYSIGLVDYSLYIPMTFDAASIVGSTLLGAVFKRLPPHKKNLALIPVLFFLMIFFILLKAIDFTVTGYFLIIALVGLCLGGCYNTMAGLVTMELVRTTPPELQTKYLRFYSALLMAIGNTITGITQIIISYTVGQDEGALFGIFVVYTAINLCSMAGVAFIQVYTLSLGKASGPKGDVDNKGSMSQVIQNAGDGLSKTSQKFVKYQQIEIGQMK